MKRNKLLALFLAACFLFTGSMSIFSYADEGISDKATVQGSYTVLSAFTGNLSGAKITFSRSDGMRIITTAHEIGPLGSFSAELDPGQYDITILRDGYLKASINNVVVDNNNIILPQIELDAGDLNGDGVINIDDIMVSKRNFDSLLPIIDINGDKIADENDFNTIVRNMMKTNSELEYTNITNLLCDFRKDPRGIDYKNPYLSWNFSSAVRGQKQTGYRLVVSSSLENLNSGIYDVWDINKPETSETGIYYSGPELQPRTEYFWTVFASDKDGNIIAPGTTAYFETGLFGDFGSDNKWISAGTADFNYTSGKIKAELVLISGAVGINFCQSEDGSSNLMWQINVTSGKPYFRPHYQKDGGYGIIEEVDLSSIFPSVSDMLNVPFEMTLEINEGTVVTYVNGTKVHTYTSSEYVRRIGHAELRIAGGEFGSLNKWQLYGTDDSLIYENSSSSPYAAPLFRKSFSTDEGKAVEKARLYVTAAGTHEMYLNGNRCSDDYLAPGKSKYNQVLYYQTYDVTDLVSSGENTLACQLGMGWYNGGPIGSDYGTKIGLKAKLIITYADGSEQVIDTDDSWLSTTDGPVITNRFYIGQYIDGRKNIDGWNENGLDTSAWSKCTVTDTIGGIKGDIVGENTNPIRVIRQVNPIEVTNPEDGVYVYKFPTNISATLRITAQAPEGTEINLRYSEMLDSKGRTDVTPYIVNQERGDQNGEDKYIFAGDGMETFEFSFVYHGFQYAEISGLSEPIPLSDITALVLSTDNIRTGYFESSNELLNTYFENTIRSQEGNFIGAITDCPTREKNNWTGDAQGFAYTANYNFNAYNIYRSFQEMTRNAQGPSGVIPEIVPLPSLPSETTKTPSGWSDTVIMIPWQLYFQYGDISFLQDSYDEMKKWADYLIRTCKNNGYVRADGWYGDNVAYDRRMASSENYPEIGTAYSAYSIGILSKIAGILGYTEDESYYLAESEKFAAAWRENFLEEDGYTCKTNTQTSYAMGIYYNLYESEEKRQLAADLLAELIQNGDSQNGIAPNVQTVGFIGYPILYYALSQHGNADTAFTLIEQTQYPSILYPVTQGSTTTWEYYSRVNSLNHFFSGCVASWLYTDILGITHGYKQENVGYQHFILQPTYGGSLTYAKGSYNSRSGEIKSEWKLSDDGKIFTYKCTVPANTTATLGLPIEKEAAVITEGGKDVLLSEGVSFIKYENGRAWYEITSGEYEFTVNNN